MLSGGVMAVLGAVWRGRVDVNATQPHQLWLDASLDLPGAHPDERLEPELVGQWRRELRAKARQGAPVVALVRWDKAMVLTGLAREEGWKTRTHRQGQGVFRVEVTV